jgi:hypothetical protein
MESERIIGFLLLVLGLVLFVFGLNATHSVADTVKEGFTGKYTDSTMWYLLGGIALVIVGGAVAFFGGERPHNV